jgi:hypothetical protein
MPRQYLKLTAEEALTKYAHADHLTKRFIAAWLNPTLEITVRNSWELLQQDVKGIDLAVLSECIRSMDYTKFLHTSYWATVSKFVDARDGHTCTRCKQERPIVLDTHHKTYEHHGLEHQFTDDLISLCRICHALEHGHLAEAICAEFSEEIHYSENKSELETFGVPEHIRDGIAWWITRIGISIARRLTGEDTCDLRGMSFTKKSKRPRRHELDSSDW